MKWLPEEEAYLREIILNCDKLAGIYKEVFAKYKRFQSKLKMPAIVIGSFTGIA